MASDNPLFAQVEARDAEEVHDDPTRRWQSIFDKFKAELRTGDTHISAIERFLENVQSHEKMDILQGLIEIHLRFSWENGNPTLLDEYTTRFEHLIVDAATEIPVELIEVEFMLRHEFAVADGLLPELDEYRRRFPSRPDVIESLKSLFLPGNRYLRLRMHAQGGLGRIWFGYDKHLRRPCAIKEPLPIYATNSAVLARFEREARLTARLDHPAIVNVLELVLNGSNYYIMRFVNGETLQAKIEEFHTSNYQDKKSKRIALMSLVRSFEAICDAVSHAHTCKIIHRDLKPENILIGKFGEVVILDWGLAKELSTGSDSPLAQSDRTTTGLQKNGEDTPADPSVLDTREGLGTPLYAPPEQFQDGGNATVKSDVFSLGAILHCLLAGSPPDRKMSKGESRLADQGSNPVRSRHLSFPDTPRELAAICRKATAFAPQKRYDSVACMADDITRFMADESISCLKDGAAQRVGRWSRRHPRTTAAMLASVIGIVLASIVYVPLLMGKASEALAAQEEAESASDDLKMSQASVSFQSGKSLGQIGKWPDALSHFDRAIDLGYPNSELVQLARFDAYAALGDLTERKKILDALEEHSHPAISDEIMFRKASMLRIQGKHEESLELFELAANSVTLSKSNVSYAKAQLSQTTDKLISNLEDVYRQDPFHRAARQELVAVYFFSGRLDEALALSESSRALFANSSEFRLFSAVCLMAKGEHETAEEMLSTAREEIADDIVAFFEEFGELFFQGRNAQLFSSDEFKFQHPQVFNPLVRLLKKGADLRMQAGAASSSDSSLRELARMLPRPIADAYTIYLTDRAWSFNPLGVFRKDHSKEIGRLDKAIEIHPEALFLLNRAAYLSQDERYKEAEESALQAAESHSLLVDTQHAAYTFAAMMSAMQYVFDGRTDEALTRTREHAEKALDLGPVTEKRAGIIIAYVLCWAGDFQQAAELMRAVPNDFGQGDVLTCLPAAFAALHDGRYLEAISRADQVLELKTLGTPIREKMESVKEEARREIKRQYETVLGDDASGSPEQPGS